MTSLMAEPISFFSIGEKTLPRMYTSFSTFASNLSFSSLKFKLVLILNKERKFVRPVFHFVCERGFLLANGWVSIGEYSVRVGFKFVVVFLVSFHVF